MWPQCCQGLRLLLAFRPTKFSLWLWVSHSLDGCFCFSILPEFQAENRGKDDGKKHVPAESTPLTSFSRTPPRDFCLYLTKYPWDSGDISVFNQLGCFWNKIGVLFIRIKGREGWCVIVSCHSMAASGASEPWGPWFGGAPLSDPVHSARLLFCFPSLH